MKTKTITFEQFWSLKEVPYTEMGIEKSIAHEIWLAARSNKIVEELMEEMIWN